MNSSCVYAPGANTSPVEELQTHKPGLRCTAALNPPRRHSCFWKAIVLIAVPLTLTFCTSTRAEDRKVEEAVRKVDAVVAQGPFRAVWDSLETYKVPKWYLDAKFGIFIHWGLYSVPAFDNEWYPRDMYLADNPVFKHHVETYGPQSQFGYKDFMPKFRAE